MQILKKKSGKISHMQVQQNINSYNLNNNKNKNDDDDDNKTIIIKTILMMIIIKLIITKINNDYKKVNKKMHK